MVKGIITTFSVTRDGYVTFNAYIWDLPLFSGLWKVYVSIIDKSTGKDYITKGIRFAEAKWCLGPLKCHCPGFSPFCIDYSDVKRYYRVYADNVYIGKGLNENCYIKITVADGDNVKLTLRKDASLGCDCNVWRGKGSITYYPDREPKSAALEWKLNTDREYYTLTVDYTTVYDCKAGDWNTRPDGKVWNHYPAQFEDFKNGYMWGRVRYNECGKPDRNGKYVYWVQYKATLQFVKKLPGFPYKPVIATTVMFIAAAAVLGALSATGVTTWIPRRRVEE